MPIYEYQCSACGHRLEKFQKISDPAPTECPECKETNSLSKLVSAAAFKLTGSGWYETDFKDKKPAKDGNKDTATTTKKSDSAKPAAKKPTTKKDS